MTKEWILTDEEIEKICKVCKQDATSELYDECDPSTLCNSHLISQARKQVEYGEQDCIEHGHLHCPEIMSEYGGSRANYPYKRFECPECRLQLKKEVGL